MKHFRAFESGRDLESPNRNISPITCDVDESNQLVIGGCNVIELAESYGTPLYLLDDCFTYALQLI